MTYYCTPPNCPLIALYADDVSILTTAHKKEDTEAAAQSVVNSVVIWSQEWKSNLNTDKSEVCLFSTWSNNSSWNPTIFVGLQKVHLNTTPPLFGVILDRGLTFNAHLKKLTALLTSGIRIISSYFLGLAPFHIKDGHSGIGSGKLDYTAPALQPWLSDTNLSCLDRQTTNLNVLL